MALLLLVVAAASAYFPKGAKGGSKSALATDPGPRPLPANAGGFLGTLSANEVQIEPSITAEFDRVHDVIVTSPTDGGLGPRFNSSSCASCHAYPAVGGSSPPTNPLFNVYQFNGANNTMPSFESSTGPILEARFINQPGTTIPDGNVHQLFTITGRKDAASCSITQPDFTTAQADGNLVLRQVSPTYGAGLIEVVRNSAIIANMNSNLTEKASLGITGHPNYSGNDGSIMRFGWKAQVRSTLLMSALQMNVEMGVTSETYPQRNRPDAGLRSQSRARNRHQFHAGNPDRNVPRRLLPHGVLYSVAEPADSGQIHYFHQERQDTVHQRRLRLLPHHFVHHAGYVAACVVEHHHQSLL